MASELHSGALSARLPLFPGRHLEHLPVLYAAHQSLVFTDMRASADMRCAPQEPVPDKWRLDSPFSTSTAAWQVRKR